MRPIFTKYYYKRTIFRRCEELEIVDKWERIVDDNVGADAIGGFVADSANTWPFLRHRSYFRKLLTFCPNRN